MLQFAKLLIPDVKFESLNLEIDLQDPHLWPDASHITMAMATIHVLNYHLSYGFENTCMYFLKISCRN